MVQKIVWSAEAKGNLADIKKLTEKDSPFYAERIVRQIYEKASFLYKHPEMEMVVYEESGVKIRRLLYKSYRILYFYKGRCCFCCSRFSPVKRAIPIISQR